MPNLDAANITYNMIRVMTGGVAIGPILMGPDKPAHVLTPASTPRRVVNMTAIAAVDAQIRQALEGARQGRAARARNLAPPCDEYSSGAVEHSASHAHNRVAVAAR